MIKAGGIFLILLLSFDSHAVQSCKLNGNEINPNNGTELNGKTGILRCSDQQGKIVREQEYKNGISQGHEMTVDFSGKKTVRKVNEKGNAIGNAKTYDAKGNLISEENYVAGKQNGWTHQEGMSKKYFTPSGKLKYLAWYHEGQIKFEAEYREDGKITRILCGEKNYFPEDRKVCGFAGGPSKVELFYGNETAPFKTIVYLNGKAQEKVELGEKGNVVKREKFSANSATKIEYFADGKPKIEAEYQNTSYGSVLHGKEKEYHSSGKLIRVTTWDDGKMMSEETYFLNGQKKARVVRKNDKNKWYLARQTFWDNGKLHGESVFEEDTETDSWMSFNLSRWVYEKPIGEHRSFHENGKIAEIVHYNESGQLHGLHQSYRENGQPHVEEKFEQGTKRLSKQWDEMGKLVLDEEYFEDGSRFNRVKKKESGT